MRRARATVTVLIGSRIFVTVTVLLTLTGSNRSRCGSGFLLGYGFPASAFLALRLGLLLLRGCFDSVFLEKKIF